MRLGPELFTYYLLLPKVQEEARRDNRDQTSQLMLATSGADVKP